MAGFKACWFAIGDQKQKRISSVGSWFGWLMLGVLQPLMFGVTNNKRETSGCQQWRYGLIVRGDIVDIEMIDVAGDMDQQQQQQAWRVDTVEAWTHGA